MSNRATFPGVGRGRARARGAAPILLGQPAEEIPPPPTQSQEETERRIELLTEVAGKVTIKPDPKTPVARDAVQTRASFRGARGADADFMLNTRPMDFPTKQGTKGNTARCVTNYFKLKKGPTWGLHEYHMEVTPGLDSKNARKALLRSRQDDLGAYIFDGMKLYLSSKLEDDPFEFDGTVNEGTFHVSIKYHERIQIGDPTYLHFYHLILRRCMYGMGLEELGRNFFDKDAAIDIPNFRLSLWPGYKTSLRQHEDDVLLCVETTHKVLRMESAYDAMKSARANAKGDVKSAVVQELKGIIVMTQYNKMTYRITDISWDQTPNSTFDRKGNEVSYADYYKEKHGLSINDMNQPLLFALPSKRDYHRGEQERVIVLIPELCQMTGMSDKMRENFSLMKELAKYLHTPPQEKVKEINHFMQRLQNWMDKPTPGRGNQETLRETLTKWGLSFDTSLVTCIGRVHEPEKITFANNMEFDAGNKADWTMAFRNQKFLSAKNLEKWAVIVPQRDAGGVDNLTRTMTRVAGPLGMRVSDPLEVVKLQDVKGSSYVKAINDLHMKHPNIQLLFVIVPAKTPEPYGTVKRRLALDLGILSQCFVAKNVTSKGLMSICTKVVVQMNAKLGGEPWSIKLPLRNAMIVGFDVYHGGGICVGAMVSTISPTMARYFSTTSMTSQFGEFSASISGDFTKCLEAYREHNGALPDRIVVYRDGVGDGQLVTVFQTELVQMKSAIAEAYKDCDEKPKLTYIVVTKKINTRIMVQAGAQIVNPTPGTVVDSVITLPWRYDFYLVSATARQGTVSPCCFNVLFDDSGLKPGNIQLMTFKLCHMYFNWSGTVAVPAPCQYAHKLAFITGESYRDPNASIIGCKPVAPGLTKLLHFL